MHKAAGTKRFAALRFLLEKRIIPPISCSSFVACAGRGGGVRRDRYALEDCLLADGLLVGGNRLVVRILFNMGAQLLQGFVVSGRECGLFRPPAGSYPFQHWTSSLTLIWRYVVLHVLQYRRLKTYRLLDEVMLDAKLVWTTGNVIVLL